MRLSFHHSHRIRFSWPQRCPLPPTNKFGRVAEELNKDTHPAGARHDIGKEAQPADFDIGFHSTEAGLNFAHNFGAVIMCDRGPQQPSSTERCGFDSKNEAEQLETEANPTKKCLVLAEMSKTERKSLLGGICSIDDDEEDIRLSCDDRTDSGIDVSFSEKPLSRHCEKHGCVTLLQLSTKGCYRMENIDIATPVAKHLPPHQLVEDWVSALLLPFEKLALSWQVPQGQRPNATTAACTKSPWGPARQIPWHYQDRFTVNVGSSDSSAGAGGSLEYQAIQDHGLFRAPPDNDAFGEHEIDVDPNQPASNEDFAGGYPCIFHNVGSVDPTPRCAWRRQYTSQLRSVSDSMFSLGRRS